MSASELSALLAHRWNGTPVAAWLTAAAILVVGWGALVLARRVALRRLERLAPKTETAVDDLLAGALRRTSKWFLFVVALAAAAKALPALRGDARDVVNLVARLAFLLQAAAWGNGAIAFWLARTTAERATHDRASVTTLNVLGLVARIVLWVLIALLALDAFGVNVTALVTGLGIAGVAVALAVQNILGDVLASLSIALDKPFAIGDFIVVDTFQGTVEHIGLKTTRLRSLTGEQIVIANAELLKARVRNFQRLTERRAAFTLTFPLDTPPEVMERIPVIVRTAVEAESPVRFDRSHFSAITDQTLAVETVYFVLVAEYRAFMDIQQRINLALLRRFAEEGVSLAVPTRSVVVRGGAEGDGRPAAATAGAAAGGATDD